MISGPQSTAARALLRWTIADLAKESGLGKSTIVDFENGSRPSTVETVTKITATFERSGIAFTRTGAELAAPVYTFDGPNFYLDLLGDIAASGAKEVIIENADDRKSPPPVIEAFRRLRESGVTFRQTIQEGNTYMILPVSGYRWIPGKYFKNWVSVVYADRLAIRAVSENPRYMVVRDPNLAEAARNRFDFVWDMLKPLTVKSTSDVLIK